MLNPEIEQSIPLVGVVDRDLTALQGLRRVSERLGMSLQVAPTVTELRSRVPLQRMAALILDLQTDTDEGQRLQVELLELDTATAVALAASEWNGPAVIRGLRLGAATVLTRPWDLELITQFLKLAQCQFREHQSHQQKLTDFRRCLAELTARQRRVLELASTGMANKLIAGQLDVSQRTVEAERSRLLEVFGADSCSGAMVRLGEYRILEQVERMRKLLAIQRLNGDRLNSSANSGLSREPSLVLPMGDVEFVGCAEPTSSERYR